MRAHKLSMTTTKYSLGPGGEVPTLVEIKQRLPAHVFESSLATSLYYVARAWTLTGALAYTLYWARNESAFFAEAPPAALTAFTALYAFLQGTVFWGWFTIGHDCGHSSFSRYHSINWVVGLVMHSLILTPFESWRVSHRHHHKNTGNIDTDEVFYPHRDPEQKDSAKTRARALAAGLGAAWFAYLFVGFNPRNVNHFNPFDPLFARSVAAVMASIAAWTGVLAATGYAISAVGLEVVAAYYLGPILVYATWLVITTFLHHNEEDVTWFGDSEWNYVKGNLSSVDRDYGVFNNVIHNIGTHQIHHLYPIIPHYKLVEATSYFREEFPELVRVSETPILSAFWNNLVDYVKFGTCAEDAQFHSIAMAKAKAGKSE